MGRTLELNDHKVPTITAIVIVIPKFTGIPVYESVIAAMPRQGLTNDQVPFPVPFWKGLVARMEGNSAAAEAAFLEARTEMEKIVTEQPNFAAAHCTLAIEQLKATLRNPNFLTYGQLKLHPFWDPLRGDARFEQIVNSLAPK